MTGSVPRNVAQACNLTKQTSAKTLPLKIQNRSDPYLNVVIQFKEQAKNPSTAFIRNVHITP